MDGTVIMKAKGNPQDSYEYKIMEKAERINDRLERIRLIGDLSGEALVELENKILDAIFMSEIDIPLYIVAMECLTEAMKGVMKNEGAFGELMKARLNVLRKTTDISLISRQQPSRR